MLIIDVEYFTEISGEGGGGGTSQIYISTSVYT